MATIVYLHGFLSSPLSSKAQMTQQWLAENRPDLQYCCPQLSSYPDEARDSLQALYSTLERAGESIYLIGSSLGGFWSTYMVEKGWAKKAVLVNPAVAPHTRFHEFEGQILKSYYSDDEYILRQNHFDVLQACEYAMPSFPNAYWLMVQKGDETLDYRLAVKKYAQSKLTVEEGGNHSFEGYGNWLPEILRFFEL